MLLVRNESAKVMCEGAILLVMQAETCSLPGTRDPEVMFRMGEDTRSCMGIRRACSRTNRALMG